jgi:sugar (pentulose or hexulose) kinase
MTRQDQLLAIDVGTQSVRAIVFDLAGNILGKQQVPIEPYFSTQPGWAEQDPALYWRAVGEACHALWQTQGLDPRRLAGVGLTTQRATSVSLDAQGRPLRPAIVWLDQRRAENEKPVGGLWGLLFRLVGVSDTIASFQAQAKANWLRAHEPELWAKTDKFLLLSGYLSWRLCGAYRDSVGCQVGYIPFDYRKLDWAAPADWKWRGVCVRRAQLPELVPPGGRLGQITAEAAAHTGIPAGLPLIAAAADKADEVLGSGVAEPGIAALSFGTTATINTVSHKYVEVTPFIPPYPSAVPGAYNTEIQIYRGFWMVSWFKQQFAHREQQLAEQKGIPPEALFDEMVNEVPPGSMGLTLQPYWSPGVREPGPEAKGAIIGFGDVHTRAHIYRAILEGLAYALRQGREQIEQRTRRPITRLVIAGGGSQSDAAMQITADIFGLPAERPHVYEASALGAAMNVAVGLWLHPDYPAAVRAMTRSGRVFQPDPETQRTYERLYRRVYTKMYGQLQPLYREIRAITGYPP